MLPHARVSILVVVVAAFQPAAQAAGLVRCETPTGSRYAAATCPAGVATPVPIDRTTATDRALPTPRRELDTVGDRDASMPQDNAERLGEHHLTSAERARLAHLRASEPASGEARVATEIEIAAIREGADARFTAADRRALEALRPRLQAADARLRADALRDWEALYARYRPRARPRLPSAPEALGAVPHRRYAVPEPPLGAEVPGARGPLVAPAVPPPLATFPARPGGPIADPKTGQVLAPAGDRLVDPLTGTLWIRAGPNYVDPTTGRVIPGR